MKFPDPLYIYSWKLRAGSPPASMVSLLYIVFHSESEDVPDFSLNHSLCLINKELVEPMTLS